MLALQFQAFRRFSPIARIRPSVSSRPTLVPNPPRHVCDKPLDRQQASQIRFALITRIAAYCALDIRHNPATGSARSPFAKAMLRKENRMKLLTSFLAVTALSLAASAFAQEESPSPTPSDEEKTSATVETTPEATKSPSTAEETTTTSPAAEKREQQPSSRGAIRAWPNGLATPIANSRSNIPIWLTD